MTDGEEREREALGGEMKKISLPTRFEFLIKKLKEITNALFVSV
jgi:hypothetical protein